MVSVSLFGERKIGLVSITFSLSLSLDLDGYFPFYAINVTDLL